jgi:uncharacterized membrane protein
MNVLKATVLTFITFCCIVALVLAWPRPVVAQEQRCTYTLSSTVEMLATMGEFNVVLEPEGRARFVRDLEALIGFRFPAVSNVLLATFGGQLVYGLEINGCLGSPQPFPFGPPVTVRKPVKGIPA